MMKRKTITLIKLPFGLLFFLVLAPSFLMANAQDNAAKAVSQSDFCTRLYSVFWDWAQHIDLNLNTNSFVPTAHNIRVFQETPDALFEEQFDQLYASNPRNLFPFLSEKLGYNDKKNKAFVYWVVRQHEFVTHFSELPRIDDHKFDEVMILEFHDNVQLHIVFREEKKLGLYISVLSKSIGDLNNASNLATIYLYVANSLNYDIFNKYLMAYWNFRTTECSGWDEFGIPLFSIVYDRVLDLK